APPWESVDEPDKILVTIEPNMAFGTGTHETTRLCLNAVSEHYRPDQSFLDVGTGTGILAIAAAKIATEDTGVTAKKDENLNKTSVSSVATILACDIDADSVQIATQNAALNGVAEKIDFFQGTVTPETPVSDFVCANLTLD